MIEITAFNSLKEDFKKAIKDLKSFKNKNWKRHDHSLHFYYTFIIVFMLLVFGYLTMDLKNTSFVLTLILGWLLGRSVNFVKETYSLHKYKIQPDWSDINFGTFGGMLASIVILVLRWVGLF